MKNATIEDVKRAQVTGVLEENIMYSAHGWLVHGKKQSKGFSQLCAKGFMNPEDVAICENADGELVTIYLDSLEPIKVKEHTQQPQQPKRKPQKGTKPFTEIPVSENNLLDFSKLPKGAKVRFRNGKVAKPVKHKGSHYVVEVLTNFWSDLGQFQFHAPQWEIVSTLLPYKEASKSKAQEDFEQGKWVPFLASETSVCPEWVVGNKIEVLLNDGRVLKGWSYCWTKRSIIVAYRKV